uniref:Uncharacterized protein n=1 Tax=Nelumbo nucifera TaxID=4432 RepID=A0A822Z746_NELNU|nr:TPA_asm: hypothetical protein HUJ06_015215 [Nelumbo nucifera]
MFQCTDEMSKSQSLCSTSPMLVIGIASSCFHGGFYETLILSKRRDCNNVSVLLDASSMLVQSQSQASIPFIDDDPSTCTLFVGISFALSFQIRHLKSSRCHLIFSKFEASI